MASQVAIKMLGTNGGGFFNANAAHPFDLVFMLLLPALSHLDQLNALAIVARKLRDRTVLRRARIAGSASELYRAMTE